MTLLTPRLLPTKTYPFSDIRHMLQQQGGGIQEGVYGGTDFKVSQRAAGANQSVDVAVGGGWVQGDDATRQGLYNVNNDAVVNVPATANASGNPRVDQLILQIFDSSVIGASDTPVLSILPGTATAGAQVTAPQSANYRAGAAALPNGAVRLGEWAAASGYTQITTAMIVDRRPFARGAYRRIVRNANAAAGSDYTTTLSTPTLIDATNLQPRIECSGAPMRMSLRCSYNNAAAPQSADFMPSVDGVADTTRKRRQDVSAAVTNFPIVLAFDLLPAAGSHLIGPAWAVTGGTGRILAQASFDVELIVEELVRQNADNT